MQKLEKRKEDILRSLVSELQKIKGEIYQLNERKKCLEDDIKLLVHNECKVDNYSIKRTIVKSSKPVVKKTWTLLSNTLQEKSTEYVTAVFLEFCDIHKGRLKKTLITETDKKSAEAILQKIDEECSEITESERLTVKEEFPEF